MAVNNTDLKNVFSFLPPSYSYSTLFFRKFPILKKGLVSLYVPSLSFSFYLDNFIASSFPFIFFIHFGFTNVTHFMICSQAWFAIMISCGISSFHYLLFGLDAGGNGGRGGDVILECSPTMWDLSALQHHIVSFLTYCTISVAQLTINWIYPVTDWYLIA